jgi:exodeoxyribonuclease VII large subunit
MARPPHRVLSLFDAPAPERRRKNPAAGDRAGPDGGERDPEEAGRRRSEAAAPPAATAAGEDAWSVTRVVTEVRQTLRQLSRVSVIGEVSGFKAWRSGHWYFDLKDDNELLGCVMMQRANERVRFDLQDGLEVVAHGRVGVYRSRLQLNVDRIVPAGQGELALAFEQLKAKLEAEGLFALERKRPLPFLPERVGLVTSAQGAALHDMLKVLRARMPRVSILLSATRVNGARAAPEIVRALSRLDEHGGCDVILLARGGGSLEDLWAFNDAELARTIARCRTPVIAGVGHETDVTIADLVADRRAATPSHAAETAVPELAMLERRIAHARRRLDGQARGRRDHARARLAEAARRLPTPLALLTPARDDLRELDERAADAMAQRRAAAGARLASLEQRLARRSPQSTVRQRKSRVDTLKERLLHASPAARVDDERGRVAALSARLAASLAARRAEEGRRLGALAASLHALSPLAVLDRGYALVSDDARPDRLVARAAEVEPGDDVRLRFADGQVRARVTERVDSEDEAKDTSSS